MPFAVDMAQSHSVTGLHHTDTVFTNWFYPQNSELLHAVGILLTQRDTLSLFLNFGWLAIAFLAAWCIGRPYGRGHLAVVAAAIVLECHTLVVREPGAAKNDLAAAALLLAAIAILINAWRATQRPSAGDGQRSGAERGVARPSAGRLPPAGLAVGLAAGTKVTVLAMAGGADASPVVAAGAAGRRRAGRRLVVRAGARRRRLLVPAQPDRRRQPAAAGRAPRPDLAAAPRAPADRAGPTSTSSTTRPTPASGATTSRPGCTRPSACSGRWCSAGRPRRRVAAPWLRGRDRDRALDRRRRPVRRCSPTCSRRSAPPAPRARPVAFAINIRYADPGPARGPRPAAARRASSTRRSAGSGRLLGGAARRARAHRPLRRGPARPGAAVRPARWRAGRGAGPGGAALRCAGAAPRRGVGRRPASPCSRSRSSRSATRSSATTCATASATTSRNEHPRHAPRLRLPLGAGRRRRPHRSRRHHRRLPPVRLLRHRPLQPRSSTSGAKGPHGAFNAIPDLPRLPRRRQRRRPRLPGHRPLPQLHPHRAARFASPEAGWLRGEPAVAPIDRSGPVTVWRVRGRLDPPACGPAQRPAARRSPTTPALLTAGSDSLGNLGRRVSLPARERALPVGGGLARPPGRCATTRPRGGAPTASSTAVRDELRRRIGPTFRAAELAELLRARAPTGACRSRSTSRPGSRPTRSRSPTRPSGSTCAARATSPAAGSSPALSLDGGVWPLARRPGRSSSSASARAPARRMTIWSASIRTVTSRWPAQCSA